MSPLDAALLRLGRAALTVIRPPLAARIERGVDAGEEERVAAEVNRLAEVLAVR